MNSNYVHKEKGGKFLKKLHGAVSVGEYNNVIFVLLTELLM